MTQDTGRLRTTLIVAGIGIALAGTIYGARAWLAQPAEGTATAHKDARPTDPAALRARAEASTLTARQSLERRASGEISVTGDPATGSLSTIRAAIGGDLQPGTPAMLSPRGKVEAFLAEQGALLGIHDPARQLRHLDIRKDQYGFSHVRYQQLHQGVPVLGAVLQGHVSPDGRLTAVNGKFIPGIELPAEPVVAQDAAEQAAIARVGQQQPAALKETGLSAKSSELLVYRLGLTNGAPGDNHLAYEVQVTGGTHVREFVYIDALTGKVVDQITGVYGLKHRRVHEGNIAAPPAWEEGMPRPAVQPAHEDEISGAGYSYNLFMNLSGGTYRSWDGNDATMITVNNDPTIICPNANWNGTSTNYCSGTSSDDVVVHEWTHAYTQETSGLIYSYQSGALNESYSDVFGETADLINNRDTIMGTTPVTGNNGPRSQDDTVCANFASEFPTSDNSVRWLMGEDAFAFSPLPPIGDAAIRDFWRPRCAGGEFFFGNPGHVTSSLYHCESSDGGGVHINSSINNRAYALLVDGETVELKDDLTPFPNPITVTGIGLTKAAHIFWRANSLYNGPASNFRDNADALEMACADLIGVNLTKLATTAEIGTGFMGSNDDTLDPTMELSGEVITAADCEQVAKAIAAVEMRHDVTKQCGFVAPLDPAPAPMCEGAAVRTKYMVDWESGIPAGWTIGQQPSTKVQLDTRPWFLRTGDLPKGRTGSAMYQENRRDLGNCTNDDESGVLYMISPPIVVDAASPSHLVFDHYFLTESSYDGGNVMISINGLDFEPIPPLAYTVIPGSAFTHNPYNGSLNGIIDQNTNPKRDQDAFHGANPVDGTNNWGQSQIDLAAAGVAPGDTIRIRWDFGQDGCNGNDGWYVDRIEVFSCGDPLPPVGKECKIYPADVPGFPANVFEFPLSSVTTATVSGSQHPVSDVNIRKLKGSHTYMGDLTFTLQSPTGTAITLFDGESCTGQDGIDVEFDDSAANVISCADWQSGGTFRPHEALAAFNGEDANGDWTLTIDDAFPQDQGRLDSWSLELCRDLPQTCTGDKATGGGFLKTPNGSKINFGFNAKQKESGPSGNLELHDKGLGTKVRLSTVTSVGAVQGSCGGIADSARALEFRGTGTYNGAPAEFRVCVEDNGRPEDDDDDGDGDDDDGDDDERNYAGPADRFHLECTSGCTYSTAARAADDSIDGGSIRVTRPCASGGNPPGGGGGGGNGGGGSKDDDDDAAVLILEPVLLSEGVTGQLQLLQVAVFGNDQEALPGVNVRLARVDANGSTQTLNAVAGPAGKALFSAPIGAQASEFRAISGGVGSNAVQVTAVPGL